MATATNGIATRANCNTIASGSFSTSLDLTKCPTKAEIIATGKLKVSGSYANNQCVRYSDIQPAISLSYRLTKSHTYMFVDGPPEYSRAHTTVIQNLNGVETDVSKSCKCTAYLSNASQYIKTEDISYSGLGFYFSDPVGFMNNYPYDSVSVSMSITHNGNSVGTFSVTAKKHFSGELPYP